MTKIKTPSFSIKSVGRLKPLNPSKKVKTSVTSAMKTPMGSSLANINTAGLGSPKIAPGFAKGGLAKLKVKKKKAK